MHATLENNYLYGNSYFYFGKMYLIKILLIRLSEKSFMYNDYIYHEWIKKYNFYNLVLKVVGIKRQVRPTVETAHIILY